MKEQNNQLDRLLDLAIAVATDAHKGQYDKGGKPYILHPTAVAESLDDTEQKIIAYLHDVCEDTPLTIDDLSKMGFTASILHSIQLLTKERNMPYEEYLKRIKTNKNATEVKKADLTHNMDISRIPNPTDKDFARVEKYKKALSFLES